MAYIETAVKGFQIRTTTEQDAELLHKLILELAVYEKLEDKVETTPEIIREWIYRKQAAEAVIAEYEGQPVGYMIFFQNYSSFTGRGGLYLEDLYIQPEVRGKGLGKALLKHLAELAVERNCARVEWTCLDWNEPSIQFYKSLGAIPMEAWTIYRLTGEPLKQLAAK